ncbi:hypothetical protein HIM_04821 [Hirsutella minnesotensis 3608]|uniref:DNA polymerase n=1 Tax=Hirsutella minnesotensis 3608 TaxID=1043627 RepID=A0A0F8A5P0_9HYPO|nr:hypothetical protein HIM_04821 [Hirsutella minnesotensis 3608]
MPLDFPSIFLLPTHLQPDELHQLEDSIPTLTYDVREAQVVVGNIHKTGRALFELRRLKLDTEPVAQNDIEQRHEDGGAKTDLARLNTPSDIVQVVKLSWLKESLAQSTVLPLADCVLYRGRKKATAQLDAASDKTLAPSHKPGILKRAAVDAPLADAQPRSRHLPTGYARGETSREHGQPHPPPSLLHQTTSEHGAVLPSIPSYLHTTYSCQRPTPVNHPNGAFVEELKSIRTVRLLQGDQIGVRAYSTAIATLAAYPHRLQWPLEIARLPGCGTKIAELYEQWRQTGQTGEAAAAASDPKITVLQLFYNIWGVGDTTAREFYRKGWRDLDDVVEYGWASLSRVQQIGVKYYDDFQVKIPRKEVESIAQTILDHARRIDAGFELTVAGGYRRGKRESGDVDVIVSHRDESQTLGLIDKIVWSLEKDGFVTHTLSLWTKNSERGQVPLPWKGDGRGRGSGFDTLDKAMVVWRQPEQKGGKSTALHRRVDIIISPWKTVGCALLGWSGGTTFQRDLRRYCGKEKGLKFDSSGIRRKDNGEWMDFEGIEAGWDASKGRRAAPDMQTAERRVLDGLGLSWRPPEERCTG